MAASQENTNNVEFHTDEGGDNGGINDELRDGLVGQQGSGHPLLVLNQRTPSVDEIRTLSSTQATDATSTNAPQEVAQNNVVTTGIPLRSERHPSAWNAYEVLVWFQSYKLDGLYEALFKLPEPITGETLATIFESKLKNYEQYKDRYTRRLPSAQNDLLKEFHRFSQLLDTYFIDKYSHRFDVAFSYPGEQRQRVEQIALRLCEKINRGGQQRIFYDRFHRAELARPNLDTYLQTIYRYQARLIVVFMCNDYSRKEWCGLESRAIRGLLKTHQNNRIMLLTVDGCVIDGITDIDGYLDISNDTDDYVANAIHERLADLGEPLPPLQPSFPSPSLTLVSTPSLLNNLADRQYSLLSMLPWFIVVALLSYILAISTGR